MATVIAKVKIMPVNPEVDRESLKEKIKKTVENMGIKCLNILEEPLAFGLYAIYVLVEMEEKEGGTEPLEKELSNLEDVESVDVVEVSLA
ncbi:elongation factor 1-beta [Methanofervidicoccus sp. A16]|uniref:elongation factor 1-beta n=1 Tax=Methanofervidicoccus sp. A16 TaxID=2607662 RepID=UPI0011899ECF|nr:elongation factor 1-beta [Methanofervidicoccus sp. A16]AXI25203.1 elongation factor 1-beta [Methanofervidicoccus sp. A16]